MTQRRCIRAAVATGLMVVAASCGTRLPDEEFVQSGTGPADGDELAASQDLAPGEGRSTTTVAGRAGTVPGGGTSTPSGAPGAGAGAPGSGSPGAGQPGAPGSSGPNQASDVGVTETTLRVGTIVAENGVLGDTFAPVARGIRAWVGHVNANGGIHGRKVELFTCDDREDRARSLQCARRLVEQDEVFAIVATNTRALGGAAPYLAEQGIPVFGLPITNSFYRWENFFSLYGAPYVRDGQQVGHDGQLRSLSGAYRWFEENLDTTKAAVVSYDIAESAQAADFIAKGLELEGFEVDQYTVSFAAPSFDQIVADMQRKGTEIVFDSMDEGANRRFCDTLSRRGYEVKAKVSTIVGMGQSLGENFNETCRRVTFITTSSLAYSQTDVPAIAEFRAAYSRYQPGQELHQWALEGFVMGRMFADEVAAMTATPTRRGLIERMNSRADSVVLYDVLIAGGYQPIDFGAERSEHCFSIARWQDSADGWVQATGSFPQCYPDAFAYYTPVRERGD